MAWYKCGSNFPEYNTIYSLDKSQGGVWVNSGIDTSNISTFYFFYSSNNVPSYSRQIQTSDIAVYTGGTDVYTTIFPQATIGCNFNVRIYNGELYVSYAIGGASTDVVDICLKVNSPITPSGSIIPSDIANHGVLSTLSAYGTITFPDISGHDYIAIKVYDTVSSVDYAGYLLVKVSDIPADSYISRVVYVHTNVTLYIARTYITNHSYSGSWQMMYGDVTSIDTELFDN